MIKLIVGPMYSQKSTILFSEANKLDIGKKKYVVIRPKTDTRKTLVRNSSNNYEKLNIQVLEKLQDLEKPLTYDYVLIDEFQFFKDSVNYVLWLSLNGVKVYISALIADSNAQGWPEVDELFHHVDFIQKLNAVCSICGDEATYSYFKGTSKDKISIGDSEYMPLCRRCFHKKVNLLKEEK